MDILNFISWIKGGRQVTTVDATKTLIPLGLKDNRRDDGYLAGAITVEDFAAQLTPPAPEPTYKVYTALLTQSGGDEIENIGSGVLTIGVTYRIINPFPNSDFTNVGAPNNDQETRFVATGITPNNWGEPGSDDVLEYNTGAPVVTVLENTIGNIWFTYNNIGHYSINSLGLFTSNKTFNIIGKASDGDSTVNSGYASTQWYSTNIVDIAVSGFDYIGLNNALNITPIEIRVYN